MKYAVGLLIFIAAMVCASVLFAQEAVSGRPVATAVDPSGHWVGTVTAPFGEVRVEVDITRTGDRLTATLNQPAQRVRALPLRNVTLDGRAIGFEVSGSGAFQGILFADGRTIGGDFTTRDGSAPFNLTREGDAVVDAPLSGPAITADLEGRWTGVLEAGGRQLRFALVLANQADGTSVGRVVSIDEGGLEVPVGIAQSGRAVTLDIRMTSAKYSGTLNTDGTELTGTFAQGDLTLPLVFRRDTR